MMKRNITISRPWNYWAVQVISWLLSIILFRWAWNWLMPIKFGLPTLSFIESFVLIFIAHILIPVISLSGSWTIKERPEQQK
jgi:hypothetical protein